MTILVSLPSSPPSPVSFRPPARARSVSSRSSCSSAAESSAPAWSRLSVTSVIWCLLRLWSYTVKITVPLRDHTVELRGFEPLTFCMPCSTIPSEGVALGLVTAVQRGFDVWGSLARSGEIWGTPVGRRRGACGSGPFPAAPGPNRTGAFQRIRLSSSFHVQFAAGLFLPRARRLSVAVSAFCSTHTSWHPVILQPPGPLRPAGGFPALPGGALLPRLLRGLCHHGTRVRQVIPRSSLSYVLARPRLPFISLDAL